MESVVCTPWTKAAKALGLLTKKSRSLPVEDVAGPSKISEQNSNSYTSSEVD